MISKPSLPQNGTVFSLNDHLSSVKRTAKIMRAKVIGYKFSKWVIVLTIVFGLVSAGTLHVNAGYSKKYSGGGGKSIHNVNKRVKASTRAGIRTGGSHSRAKVNNSINVSVGGGSRGGGHGKVVIRSGSNGGKKHHKVNRNNNRHNNNNGGSKKRVVRKTIKNIDNSYTDNSYTDNSFTDNSVTEIDQTIKNKIINKNTPSDDCNYDCYKSDYNNDNDYSSYWGKYSDDCGCYSNDGKSKVINNNNLTHDVYNSQSVDLSN